MCTIIYLVNTVTIHMNRDNTDIDIECIREKYRSTYISTYPIICNKITTKKNVVKVKNCVLGRGVTPM